MKPIVWTIAGSDSGGGAGIQADLKTMNALGAHGCSVITALTAQNTVEVSCIEPVSLEMLRDQLEALRPDLPPVAVKLGMLGGPETIAVIRETLDQLDAFIVCDPVMISTAGQSLLQVETLAQVKTKLLPGIHLLTPNLPEAEALLSCTITSDTDIEQAAFGLLKLGVRSVLLKGGHGSAEFSQDFYTDGVKKVWLTSPRKNTRHTHGTGCTLSAAVTACIALGYEPLDAIVIAKAYVNQGLRLSPELGQGCGPLMHGSWPEAHEDLPWLTETAQAGRNRLKFLDCGSEPLGFYPIIDRADWLKRLLPLGVSTVQLRIKDLSGEELEREIANAAAYARTFNARLFINDYWQLALKYKAYGVHLGQEDLETADLKALCEAGIRLGVSTHCYHEVARALAIQPSYLAIGPIFSTTTKVMRFAPQGLEMLRRWRRTLPYPLVAIGGMFIDNAPDVLAAGADGIATVRDIVNADDVPAQVVRWLALFHSAETRGINPPEHATPKVPLPC